MFGPRIFETTLTTGTGAYTLLGAQTGYIGYASSQSGFSNGDTVAYHCRNEDGTIWEDGYGALDTGAGTIQRTVLGSSTGAKINWSSGTKYIYCQPMAAVLKSMAQGNAGASRPGWLSLGFWADTANSLWKYFNGSADVPLLPLGARTQGDILYHGASGVAALLAAGTAGQSLRTGGAGANPAWGWGLDAGPSSELTLASGAVTATGGHHSLDTESDAASDDLDTITVTALREGQSLVLKAENAARVVTVKDGTGNITLGGGDFALDTAAKRLLLQKIGSNLVEVCRSAAQTITGETAKVHINFNGSGTVATNKSLNVSSLVDNGTGAYTVNIDGDMADGLYTAVSHLDIGTDAAQRFIAIHSRLAGSFQIDTEDSSGSQSDVAQIDIAVFGDLA